MKKVGQFSGSIFRMRFVRAMFLSALLLIITTSLWAQLSATIEGNATVCQGGPPPLITFTGTDGVAPYTRYVHSEHERIEKAENTLAIMKQKISELRARSQAVAGN